MDTELPIPNYKKTKKNEIKYLEYSTKLHIFNTKYIDSFHLIIMSSYNAFVSLVRSSHHGCYYLLSNSVPQPTYNK